MSYPAPTEHDTPPLCLAQGVGLPPPTEHMQKKKPHQPSAHVLRIFSAEGGLLTAVRANGSVGLYCHDTGEAIVPDPKPGVMVQADMVMLTRPGELRALAMFFNRAAEWMEEQDGN